VVHFRQYADGVLSGHQGQSLAWREGKHAADFPTPVSQVVYVVDSAVDETAAAHRRGLGPPIRVRPKPPGHELKLPELPEPTLVDEPAHAPDRRHVVEVLRDHQDPAGCAGRIDHPIGLLERARDRLLDEDVPAVRQREERIGQVPVVRRAHEGGRDPRVGERPAVVVERGEAAEFPRVGARPRAAAAGEHDVEVRG